MTTEQMLALTAQAVELLTELVIETRRHNREMERLTETKQHSSYVKPENDLLARTTFHHLPRPREAKLKWSVYDGAGKFVGTVHAHTAAVAGEHATLYFGKGSIVATVPTLASL